ncbi:MAG: hypothetical protein CMB99_01995 [Flavobacteriaceae bacterium]|nr:hypothetical protein [Flavobacteriaceae bacterium]
MENLQNDFALGISFWQGFLFLCIILWIYCLIDIFKIDADSNNKLIWGLLVFFVPFLGSMLYLLMGRRKMNQS